MVVVTGGATKSWVVVTTSVAVWRTTPVVDVVMVVGETITTVVVATVWVVVAVITTVSTALTMAVTVRVVVLRWRPFISTELPPPRTRTSYTVGVTVTTK